MEWKRVKSALILLFLIVDIFLAYQVYSKNITTNSDTIDALNSILVSRNITFNADMKNVGKQPNMAKLLIAGDEVISEDVLVKVEELSKDTEYIGKKREIIDLSTLMATYIRDTKAENIEIKDIYLCYFYNSDQIGENVKYAEAEPSWVIEVEGKSYVYSAYTGNFSKVIS